MGGTYATAANCYQAIKCATLLSISTQPAPSTDLANCPLREAAQRAPQSFGQCFSCVQTVSAPWPEHRVFCKELPPNLPKLRWILDGSVTSFKTNVLALPPVYVSPQMRSDPCTITHIFHVMNRSAERCGTASTMARQGGTEVSGQTMACRLPKSIWGRRHLLRPRIASNLLDESKIVSNR